MKLLFVFLDTFYIIFSVNFEFTHIFHVLVPGDQIIRIQKSYPYNENNDRQDIFIPEDGGNFVFKIKPDNHDTNLQFFFQPPLMRYSICTSSPSYIIVVSYFSFDIKAPLIFIILILNENFFRINISYTLIDSFMNSSSLLFNKIFINLSFINHLVSIRSPTTTFACIFATIATRGAIGGKLSDTSEYSSPQT